MTCVFFFFFFFQAEDGIRDLTVTGVQTCALPILAENPSNAAASAARSLPAPEEWAASDAPFEPRCCVENPADLLFTTGTTERRKGVLLSHGNIASAATNINAFIGTSADDIEIGRASCR